MKKTNNKGFSLVELIVVVLILGILAVAVTPQIMKWVDKSKISSDKDNANALKSSVQTALAEWQSEGGTIHATEGEDYVLEVKDGACNVKGTDKWGSNDESKTILAYVDEVTAADYPKAQYDLLDGDVSFEITISAGTGKVTVKCQATEEEADEATGE